MGDNALDINAQDHLGRSALHWAAAIGREDSAKQLTMHLGTNRLLKDQDGRTPLHEAAVKGHLGIVGLLLQHEEIRCSVNTGDNFNRTALHWAAENGNESTVQILLEKGVEVSREDSCRNTALHRAIRNGHLEVAMVLVEKGAKAQAAMFHLATEGNHRVVGELLFFMTSFENEDKPTIPEHREIQGLFDATEPLHWVAERGHAALVKQLLATGKVHVDLKDKFGRTLLSKAAENGYTAIVQQLLETGKIDVDLKDHYDENPLSKVAGIGHAAIVQQLLGTGKADVNQSDHVGFTPLEHAVNGRHTAVIQQLLEARKVMVDWDIIRSLLDRVPEGEEMALKRLLFSFNVKDPYNGNSPSPQDLQ